MVDDQSCRRLLNNFARRRHIGDPQWDDKYVEQQWTCTVQVDGTEYGKGKGPNKAAARELAARQALELLKIKYGNA
ncbi:hypothetical protein APHAL10511_003833 [Amanita phalloides]|nr:hypothetical protein APHAL10511_003833 [Amanita phalloides]